MKSLTKPGLLLFVLLCLLAGCTGLPLPGVITVPAPGETRTAGSPNSTRLQVTPPGEIASTPGITPPDLISPPAQASQSVDTPVPGPSPTVFMPTPQLPKYVITAKMDYDAQTLDVQEEIDYPNTSAGDIQNMLLAVEPNLITGVFTLNTISQDDQAVSDYSLNGQRLTWKLASPLQPGQIAHFKLQFQLVLPDVTQGDPNVIRPQIFGVTARQVNLTDWYPMVVPYDPGTGWRLADPWFYGEHLVYPLADFDITLQFKDPASAPVVAASGLAQPVDGGYQYVMENGRDFIISMGRQLKVTSATVDGVTISSYYYPGSEAGGKAVLDATSTALKTYTDLFGSYPHKTLAAVQGDFNDGMEFDGLYYLSNSFYNLYDGTQNNYLPMVAAHETSHQWWFGRVASDQSKHPWMDEALASYSEKLFYEKNYPDSVKWWWSYRIDFYQPQGMIDGSVSSYGGFTPYTNAVYKMGAHFFEDLRQTVGDDAFFAFLKEYSTQMDGKIAEPDDFFRILHEVLARMNVNVDLNPVLSKYFANPPG